MEQGADLAARVDAAASAGLDTRQGLPSASELGLGKPNLAVQQSMLKLVFIFRNPHHQACRKLVGKKRRPPVKQGAVATEAGAEVVVAAAAKGGGGAGNEKSPEQVCWEGIGAAQPGPWKVDGVDGKAGPRVETGTGLDGSAGGAGAQMEPVHPTDFHEYFEWMHESEVCPRYWTNNYHAVCYAEHLEEWLRVGYSLDQMHFVKSEELKDMSTREAVVAAAAR